MSVVKDRQKEAQTLLYLIHWKHLRQASEGANTFELKREISSPEDLKQVRKAVGKLRDFKPDDIEVRAFSPFRKMA